MKIRIMNQEAMEEALDILSVIDKVEECYKLKFEKKAELWPVIFHEFKTAEADMDIKSGYMDSQSIFGLKLVSWFKNNAPKGLPVLFGSTMIFDIETGAPLGIVNGEYVTGMRTGAAGAIGAKYLAREESENLLIVGTGHQSIFQIAATLSVMKNIKNVMIFNHSSFEKSLKFSEEIKDVLREKFLSRFSENKVLCWKMEKRYDVNFIPMKSLEAAVKISDIIITVTPSRRPLIKKSWVKPGTHFSCIGSDMSGKQDLIVSKLAIDISKEKNIGQEVDL